MTGEIVIRKVGPDEIGTIVLLANAIWPQTYSDILSAEQIAYMMELFYSPSSLQEQMTSKQHQFVILEYQGKPTGFASYSPTSEHDVHKLQKIYVLTNIQGKGLGKALINFVIDELKLLHATALELNVNRNNKARWFYEKLGFEVIREEDIDIGAGYYMNDFVMRKVIRDV